ncbi:PREDICTED: malonyl-CoA decarboxylase, mitochondrial-like [Priapulus caudatus]|uniref:Malonyl-CoA decarboxylase, mitochondrial-like n=1 Tax=Priapulus caudatus TaxID=37621 RepID=A0ABM1EQT5_PRICU|nr:PREDICTED: malonyl-CoA decarboxylase, mitochondrial-like [Priapulus caudatus]
MLWVYSLLFSLKNARTKIFAAPAGLVRRMAAGASFAAVREILDDIVDHPLHVNEEGTREICSTYKDLERDGRLEFMRMLASDYSVKHQNILEKAEALVGVKERGDPVLYNCEKRLHVALTPKFLQLFQAIAKLPEGVKFVVDMRAELLEALQDNSLEDRWQELRKMNESLHDLLSLWFSVGFLHLQRVTWESSCDMMQKISSYEAVHPVRNWTDIKRRVGPYRRCYVFVHNSMPGEPIVVLHTALTESIATNVQSLVSLADTKNLQDEKEDPKKVVAANFYSITSTQRGLQGIELGYHLIKRTVTEILKEFSQLQQFSSLSPIPGFRSWLLGEINMYLSHPAEHSCPLSAGEVITIAYVFQIPADAPSVLTTIKHTLLAQAGMADEKSRGRVSGRC